MIFQVMRGEYPFNQLIGVVDAPEDQPELALSRAIEMFKGDQDFFCRHPVVQPTTEELQ